MTGKSGFSIKSILPLSKHDYQLILQVCVGILFVLLGIYFIRHEQTELASVKQNLTHALPVWVFLGLIFVIAFVWIQGLMYQVSFAATGHRIHLKTGVLLYLRRNLISVFLPAGVLTNMMFYNKSVEKKEGVDKTQIYLASTIFTLCSIATGILVGIPGVFWLLLKSQISKNMAMGILLIVVFVGVIIYAAVSYQRKGKFYVFLEKRLPGVVQTLSLLDTSNINRKKVFLVAGLSMLIECIGIIHLFLSAKALGLDPSLEMAIVGYSIVLLLLMTSPFLRGMGAVELALSFALTLFGLSTAVAISVAFLFRFFEFWSLLVLGILAVVGQKNNLFLRMTPSILLFVLGIVNIFSSITPAIPERLQVIQNMLSLEGIHASTWIVFITGFILMGVSVFLVRGLRNAWIMAVILTSVSLIGHLTKGIDWEEATLALVVLGSLVYQRKQYFIKSDIRLLGARIIPGVMVMVTVIVFGTLGFFWLSPTHFNTDFNLWDSFSESVTTFLLMNVDLTPATRFGKDFLLAMHLMGGTSLLYIFFLLLRPLIFRPQQHAEDDFMKAKELVNKHGRSSLDYFKTYYDKQLWFSPEGEGFVAFKTTQRYAIVLEDPVLEHDYSMAEVVREFDGYCRENGLRTIYYRIPESSKGIYESLEKKLLPIGEEAWVNLENWSMEGSDKRALRNIVHKFNRLGYTFRVHPAPQTGAFLQQLQSVSDEWLKDKQRSEIVFSQGLFDEKELKNQTILSLDDPEGKVAGFVNLVPGGSPDKANFDLMRSTDDAPGGTMDVIFVNMFEYLRSEGFRTCTLGMVPLSGIVKPENVEERVIKLAYEKIRQFSHYRGLHSFKDKFEPDWEMMYLAYNDPYDLFYLPRALDRVIKP